MCEKNEYLTEEEARSAIQGIGKSNKGHMRYYRCLECGSFHITTCRGRPKLFTPRNKYPFKIPAIKKDTKKSKKKNS